MVEVLLYVHRNRRLIRDETRPSSSTFTQLLSADLASPENGRLNRLNRLNMLNRLRSINRLNRLNRLNRINRINRLNRPNGMNRLYTRGLKL